MDNKVVNILIATDTRKIRCTTLLFRRTATEWVLNHTTDKKHSTFALYRDFKKKFLKRFTELNPTGITMEKLLNLKQGRIRIQVYCMKILNLAGRAEIDDQTAKALMFRGLHPKDQDRIMIANSISTKQEL